MSANVPRIDGGVTGVVVVFALVCMTASSAPVYADGVPETIEIRGERLTVWPAEDLRLRGLDLPDVPRERNAAYVYLEAANTYLDTPEDLREALDYAILNAWPPDQRELHKWLTGKENRAALDLARKAAAMEQCQFPHFGDPNESLISMMLPPLRHQRMLAKMLVADGRRLVAQRDYVGAADNFIDAMRMGHHVGEGVTLIENLVGLACWSLGANAVRDMVLRYPVSEQELTTIAAKWEAVTSLQPTTRRGLDGERLFGPSIVDDLVCRPTELPHNLSMMFDTVPSSTRSKDGWDRLEARLGQVFLPDRTIKRHMKGYYDLLVENADLPAYDQRVRDFDADVHDAYVVSLPSWDIVSRSLLPSLSRARAISDRCSTDTRMTTITLALQRAARQNRGKFPTRLADLPLDADSDALIDPFSGEEFGYVCGRNGWKLHSVGPDRTDNGGTPGERWDTEGTDMVLTFPAAELEPFAASEDDE